MLARQGFYDENDDEKSLQNHFYRIFLIQYEIKAFRHLEGQCDHYITGISRNIFQIHRTK